MPAMKLSEPTVAQALAEIDQSTFDGDDLGRRAALIEAQNLVNRLEKPHEFINKITLTQPMQLIVLKIASESGLFLQLSSKPKTVSEIAAGIGGDEELVERLTRLLGATGVIKEVAIDTFVDTELSAQLKDKNGMITGVQWVWDVSLQQMQNLPTYFKETKYKNPIDAKHPPWCRVVNSSLGMFEWLNERPEVHTTFNNFLASLLSDFPKWTEIYPTERLLEGYNPETALCVDVGGGHGIDMLNLAEVLPEEYKNARLVLEDQPNVVAEAAKRGHLPANVETVPYSFFNENPVKGARTYLIHSCLHNWPDKESAQILSRLREAMTPGYSKLLIYEPVIPASVDEVIPIAAALDLHMMCHCAAGERTQKQWEKLLGQAGLRFKDYTGITGFPWGVIEAEAI
ncbi:hypothetical protein CKM354_000940700 [Cercospora kikuchii]|uniref:O-methyltransferase C-terminal domain-containing protein n=1 Tax=Cercospora kikuchii TaxID=84275 RepID=A0A9P3FKB1_9PEZI|nr:uncharacterized protein CKM354_000940700 [Cercospora kikuchii]GIZ46275.1 hypothetical protein CKM354_000940700 [Cercospora kikuchii]